MKTVLGTGRPDYGDCTTVAMIDELRAGDWHSCCPDRKMRPASLVEQLQADNIKRLKAAIFWACGAVGDFPGEGDPSKGQFFWRAELRKRAGITDKELNNEARRALTPVEKKET